MRSRKSPRQPRHPRLWICSPEDFRELRLSCFLSREACAELLGVAVATIRSWETGRSRVHWACVRLLRFYRHGDLGAIHEEWSGWKLTPAGLFAPDGRRFEERRMRLWWNTAEQARLWRKQYEAGTQLQLFD